MRYPSPDLDTLLLKVTIIQFYLTFLVSKSKVILFGGATGDTGRYVITGDTYALDIIGNKWSKLEGKCLLYNLAKLDLMFIRLWNCAIPKSCARKLLSRLSSNGRLRWSHRWWLPSF